MKTDTTRIISVRLRQARFRINLQRFLRTYGIALGSAFAFSILWLFASPFFELKQPKTWNLAVLGSSVGLALIFAVWRTWKLRPSDLDVAMAIDREFELQERLTATCSLPPELAASPVGLALTDDAKTSLEKVKISQKFVVRPGWRALFLPAQVAAIALVWFLYDPVRLGNWARGNATTADETTPNDIVPLDKAPLAAKPFIKRPAERADQFKDSKELQDLQTELEKLYADNNREKTSDKPEQIREKVADVAKAEETLRKHEEKMAEKFQKLQKQLETMTQLDKGEARADGPGKDFEEALSKGDLKAARDEADRLKKKARDKGLDQKEAEQLKKELDRMEERADTLRREQKEKEKQLKDLVDKAKKENRDAESLERELKDLQQEMAASKESQKLAEAIQQAKKALEEKDFEGLAEQMEQMSKQLGDLQDQLQDLEDIEEHLQNLKEMKKSLCKECEGDGQKKGKGGEKDNSNGFAEGASGKREENKNAVTRKGEEAQARGFFDARGKKRYGGTTNGPAFKQRSSAEMAGEIQQAVQEAPEAVEVQRLPRAAKEMVREYFEKLGGQTPKK